MVHTLSPELRKHLKEEHGRSPASQYLKEIVYGGNDGIVTTFAVVAGFAGASGQQTSTLPLLTVLLFGFANLFADAVSMALGNFLSSTSEIALYRKEQTKERQEIRTNAPLEKEETIHILTQRGFSLPHAQQLATLYMHNEDYWLEFMMSQELGMANPADNSPATQALATFFSFIAFGLIPLSPYVLFPHAPSPFFLSCIATIAALLLLGILRWKVSAQAWTRSIAETLLLGGAAATVAYGVGSLF